MGLKIFIRVIWRLYLKLRQAYLMMVFSVKWSLRNSHNRTIVSRIFPIECVTVGANTYGELNVHSFANGNNEHLVVGDYVSIADNVHFLMGGNHNLQTLTTAPLKELLLNESFQDSYSKGPIVVEDEVWIGFGTIILSGIKIGKGAVVAAGSVLTKDVEPYTIVGGNPAKLIKYRFSEDIITRLLDIRLSKYKREDLINRINLFYVEISDMESLDCILNKINVQDHRDNHNLM